MAVQPVTPDDGSRRALAWLAHPITLAALAVLIVNDHLLKPAWPGLVTGKLSDLAGLVVAPALLATVVALAVRRCAVDRLAAASVVAVGVGFTIVKSVPVAASMASAAWSVLGGPSLVRADLTDLLALPALALAWQAWTRARRRPAPGNLARALRLALVLPVALAGVAATSQEKEPEPRRLFSAVGVGAGTGGDVVLLVSARTTADAKAEYDLLGSHNGFDLGGRSDAYDGTAVEAALAAPREACRTDGDTCYRVVAGRLAVEESADGGLTWTIAWEIPDATRDDLAAEFKRVVETEDTAYAGEVDAELSCVGLFVLDQNDTVFAACGLAGFVRFDGFQHWERIALD